MTYTLQELEALCAAATPGPWFYEPDHHGGDLPNDEGVVEFNRDGERLPIWVGRPWWREEDAPFIAAARTAIPELIAEIRRLDPSYSATPAEDAVARAMALSRQAGEKRAKLDQALKDAGHGDLNALSALGLEAFMDDDGNVKIKAKARKPA